MSAYDEILGEFCQPGDEEQVIVVRFVAPSGKFVSAWRIDLSTRPPTREDLPPTHPAVLDAARRFRARMDRADRGED